MNPIGLKALKEQDAELLFGREKEVESILQIIQKNKLITLSGPSGSGKSSLLNAGLTPRLRKGFLGQAGKDWSICSMRPGLDPIGNLSYAISFQGNLSENEKSNPDDPKNFKYKITNNEPLGIIQIFKESTIYNKRNLLIIVDHLEDLFKYSDIINQSGNPISLFFNSIIRTVKEKDISIYFAFAIQTQYLSILGQYTGLQNILNSSLHSIQNIEKDALCSIALSKGIQLDNETKNYIWEETYPNICYLPNYIVATDLLSWKIQNNELDNTGIKIEDFESIGGIKGVINQRCELFYNSLSEDQKILLEKFFKSGSNYEQENSIVYYTSFKDLCENTNENRNVLKELILELKLILGESIEIIPFQITGITSTKNKVIAQNSYISLTYNECRNWQRESTWAKEELMSFEQYKEFHQASKRYHEGKSSLLISPELENAISWKNNPIHNKNWANKYSFDYLAVISFIDKSESDFNYRKKIEKERLERKRRNTRRIITVVSTLMVISVAASIWGYEEQKAAKSAEKDALNEKVKAEKSQKEAVEAEQTALIEMRKAKAAKSKATTEEQKARIAYAKAEKNRIEAEISKLEAMKQRDKSDSLSLIALTKEKQARASEEKALNLKMISDLETEFYPLILELNRNAKMNSNSQLTDNSPVVKNIKEAVEKYEQYEALIENYKNINNLSFVDSETEGLNMLLQNSLEILINSTDTNSSQSPMNIHSNSTGGGIRSLATFKNNYLALGGDDQTITIFDILNKFKRINDFNIVVGERIRALEFKSASELIVSTFRGSIYLYNLNNKFKTTLYRSSKPINYLFLTSENQLVGISDSEIVEINLKKLKPKSILLESSNTTAAFNHNGTILFVNNNKLKGYKDGSVRNIEITNDSQMSVNQFSSLLIQSKIEQTKNTAKNYLLAGTKTGQIVIFEEENSSNTISFKFLGEFTIHNSEITKLYFDADAQKTYSASFDNQVKKYTLNFDNISESAKTNIALNGHEKWVWDIIKVKDNNNIPLIITADENGNAMYWHTNQSDLYKKINTLLNENIANNN